MNYIFISPNFPEAFYKIAVALKNRGVTVLGIGDAPYDDLKDELKDALTEYARVNDMSVYQHMLDTCGYYESKYGKSNQLFFFSNINSNITRRLFPFSFK